MIAMPSSAAAKRLQPSFDATQLARASRALEARLLLLCQWLCERHGLVGCVAVYRGATAIPWHERISLSDEQKISRTMRMQLAYQLNWNDRFDSGEPVRSYRFDYQVARLRPRQDDCLAGSPAANAMNDVVLQPAVQQLKLLQRRRDLRSRTCRSAHRADRAAQPATQCLCRFRSGPRACTGARNGCYERRAARCCGLPVTVKSSIATAGYKCEIGSLLHKGDRAARRCSCCRALARGRSADSRHDQLPGVPDGLRDRQPAPRSHRKSVGSGAYARRVQRRGIGSHRRRHVRRGTRLGQRRICARARAFHRHLLAQADTRAAFPALDTCRPVSDHSPSSAPSGPWRGPWTMSRCCSAP